MALPAGVEDTWWLLARQPASALTPIPTAKETRTMINVERMALSLIRSERSTLENVARRGAGMDGLMSRW